MKQELAQRQDNIESMSASIVDAFRRSNQQKYRYLTRKLELSRKLLAISQRRQELQAKQQAMTEGN